MSEQMSFDPHRAQGDTGADSMKPARRNRTRGKQTGQANALSVSQLAHLIKSTLEQRIDSPLRVVGEISNLNRRGHWYFSLKDEQAVIHCVAWASSAARFGVEPKDGDEVVATGHISHFPPQGRTQLYVTDMKPVGAGALERRFRELCAQLRKQGYFDPQHKRPVPVFPRRIAVITSESGAALQDVVATAKKRNPAVGILVVDVRVQGDSAAGQIAQAIRWVDQHAAHRKIDAILVTRGGGSIEDLWAFNERIVADAVFRCHLPLVAAIGLESDTTIIELVADVRAANPTQAAMLMLPDRADLLRQYGHLHDRLHVVLRHQLQRCRDRLNAMLRHDLFRRPEQILLSHSRTLTDLSRRMHLGVRHRVAIARRQVDRLENQLQRLHPHALVAARQQRWAILTDRLHRAIRHRVDRRLHLQMQEDRLQRATGSMFRMYRSSTDALGRQLMAIDPRHVLQRGFSYTTLDDGKLVRSFTQAPAGTALTTHVADGSVRSVVSDFSDRVPRPPQRATGKKSSPTRQQMDLFGKGL